MSELTIRAEHIELRQFRPWLDGEAEHIDPTTIGRIELCVLELAANVIDHSGAEQLLIRLTDNPSHLVVELLDSGNPLAPAALTDLEPHPRIRGYGMMIAEQLASELTYERQSSLNVWRATFDLP